jgi:hypothetical protein
LQLTVVPCTPLSPTQDPSHHIDMRVGQSRTN